MPKTPRKRSGPPLKQPPAYVERIFTEIAPADAAERIEKMAAEGRPQALAAKALGTSPQVFRRWLREHPTLQVAWEYGRAQLEFELVKEVRRSGREYARPMFLLKTMFSYREQGDPIANSLNQVQVNITLPGAMTLEAFRELRNASNGDGPRIDSNERLPKARPITASRA